MCSYYLQPFKLTLCNVLLAQLQQLLALRQPLPALFCAPVLVKDNFDTVGMAATAGAVGLLDNFATEDAFVVSSSSPSFCMA